MAPPTVITMMVGMLAMALAPLVLCDTVCQPGAQLTFILQCVPTVSRVLESCVICRRSQTCASCFACGLRIFVRRLPTAGNQPTAFTNATLTNAVSGVVSASGFPSGINNIQVQCRLYTLLQSCNLKAIASSGLEALCYVDGRYNKDIQCQVCAGIDVAKPGGGVPTASSSMPRQLTLGSLCRLPTPQAAMLRPAGQATTTWQQSRSIMGQAPRSTTLPQLHSAPSPLALSRCVPELGIPRMASKPHPSVCNMLNYLPFQQAACAAQTAVLLVFTAQACSVHPRLIVAAMAATWGAIRLSGQSRGCLCTTGLRLLAVAVQNNLDNVQGQQGLQLLGLPEVMELCTGTVITGAPPLCPPLNRHQSTVLPQLVV